MKMNESKERSLPPIAPDEPPHPNEVTAMIREERHKQQRIVENNQTYAEVKLRSRDVRMLHAWDDFLDRLCNSRKEK